MSEKLIVLGIDDNLQQLSEFRSILVPRYDLRVVKSASEAIAFLIRNSADIILLDIEMPNISGFEFLSDLKKIPTFADTPVIIVSGNSSPEFMIKARNSGVADVLTKPVKPDILVSAIEKTIAASPEEKSGE